MERQSGLSELSVISWVSAVEGCPLSRVPPYLLGYLCFTQRINFSVDIDSPQLGNIPEYILLPKQCSCIMFMVQ